MVSLDSETRAELIGLIEQLLSGQSCMRLDGALLKLKKHLPDPDIEQYIFNPEQNLTAAQIVDKAAKYKD